MYSPPRTGGSHISSLMSSQRRKQTSKQQRSNARSVPQRGKQATNTVRAPAAMNRSSRQTGKNSTSYRECERIATVNGSVLFRNVLDIPCNPGLATSFPWLSGHAALYESYIVHSVTYRYKNLKGTDADGNILLSFDYDTLDEPPSTAIAQSQSTVWIDGAPWRIFEMKVPSGRQKLFTRSSVIPGTDLKTYDFGRLHVSAEGCADESAHGYLEVEYNIELVDKQVGGTAGSIPSGSTAMFVHDEDSGYVDFNDVLPFERAVANPLGIVNLGIQGFQMPTGRYLISFQLSGIQSDADTAFAVFLDEFQTDHVFKKGISMLVNPTIQVSHSTIVAVIQPGTLLSLRPIRAGGVAATTTVWDGVGRDEDISVLIRLA